LENNGVFKLSKLSKYDKGEIKAGKMKYRFVYICHPVKGDSTVSYEENLKEIKKISRELSMNCYGIIPVTHVLATTQYLDDFNKKERNVGIKQDLQFIPLIAKTENPALFVYGHKISSGMKKEILAALKYNVTIIPKDERIIGGLEKIVGGNKNGK